MIVADRDTFKIVQSSDHGVVTVMLSEEQAVYFNVYMSEMLLTGLRHASPLWLNLLSGVIGLQKGTYIGHVDAVNLPGV